MKKKIIVSAVNLTLGGTLTVVRELLNELDRRTDVSVIALVHDKKLFESFKHVKLIAVPTVKKSWIKRLWFEFFISNFLSKRLLPDYWLCMHDISAKISHGKQFVYCHNPSPFYKKRVRAKDLYFDWKFFLFNFFYGTLYRINIKSNYTVFVQQSWIAEQFKDKYKITNVKVVRPYIDKQDKIDNVWQFTCPENGKIKVFYPSIPRVFKNFEVILQVAKDLEYTDRIEFILTFDGSENKYSKSLYEKYKDLKNTKFIGVQSKDEMEKLYSEVDIVCFPSKLETWGLPITEAKSYKLPLILADLPYAYETLGTYNKVVFFPPEDAIALKEIFIKIISNQSVFIEKKAIYNELAIEGWASFVNEVLKD
ncbi:glycosyltransferase [Escherichia coli]|uniref:glycosyltransferase n=1 Tax=Escherichia coli TaxID=562 RepID=UPI000E1C76A8|nr:glycosyltransferase [Escherichia coli]EID0495876.1 glycosyltransferase [Escherichia coli]ELR0752520.1 glycosyltransferase [Escherichia coli]RDQ24977.1 Glycosyl transferases group 1 [Escherichia coli]HBA8985940.1 glycosyltransferase family 4 protein [Escherichia coli]HBA9053838.1 glycosyltransferase family 4 protein [Escherichia coli]